jgi:hypothetical protein
LANNEEIWDLKGRFSNIPASTISSFVLNPRTKIIPECNLKNDYTFAMKATWQIMKKSGT